MHAHLKKGLVAEKKALSYLKRQGLSVISKNYRCYQGEIDLIMRDQATVIFVEIRYRTHTTYGGALQSVNQAKIRRIGKTAWNFLTAHPQYQYAPIRFDVIALESDLQINWIKNAFEVQY